MNLLTTYITILLALLSGQAIYSQNNSLLMIKNDKVVVGISPRLGGRIMLLKRPDGKNVLKSNVLHWEEAESCIPEIKVNSRFKEYNGHIVWLAPQKNWWKNQEFDVARKKNAVSWPPDPFLLYGKYQVVTNNHDIVTLNGPDSLVSGVKMVKTYRIYPDGKVKLTVSMKNISSVPVSWGIWSNTRLEGRAKCWASINTKRVLQIGANFAEPSKERNLNFVVKHGYFSYINTPDWRPGIKRAYSKAQFSSDKGIIFAFVKGDMFVKQFPVISKALVAPGHSPVEIFLRLYPKNKELDLLELENHSKYVTLQPNEEFVSSEVWQVIHCPDWEKETSQQKLITDYVASQYNKNTKIIESN